DCKNRAVSSYAEGKREHGNRRKARTPAQLAQSVSEVLSKSVHFKSVVPPSHNRISAAANGAPRNDAWPKLKNSRFIFHSYRNATAGSTVEARKAGTGQAIAATSISNKAAAKRVKGSRGLPPAKDATVLPSARLRMIPTATPMPSTMAVELTTVPRMLARCAP